VRSLDELRRRLDFQISSKRKAFQEFLKAQEGNDVRQKFSGSNEAVEPASKESQFVVQEYIKAPALINGHKFDFRIYVLLLSVEPMTILIFEDGLVRLASEKYSNQDVGDSYVHLTNYSLNKKNEKFD
jgi:hypothetical protein